MPDIGSMMIEERVALRARPPPAYEGEFEGIFGIETIEQFLYSSYDEFAPRATVRNFLALMAERFARQRLTALAKVEGHPVSDGDPSRAVPLHPQRRPLPDGPRLVQPPRRRPAVAWSGGSDPASEINPAAVAAMAEIGIDISDEFPKPWTDEIVRAADVVVTMGCGDACPIFPGKPYEDWGSPTPPG